MPSWSWKAWQAAPVREGTRYGSQAGDREQQREELTPLAQSTPDSNFVDARAKFAAIGVADLLLTIQFR